MKPALLALSFSAILVAFRATICVAQSSTSDPADSSAERVTRVIVSGTAGLPGEMVYVPIRIEPAARLKRLRLTLKFNSTFVKYERLSPGSSRGTEAKLTGFETATEYGNEISTATIEASLAGQRDDTGILPGNLATLTFRISEHTDGRSVVLQPSVEAVLVDSDEPLPPEELVALEGKIGVARPDVMMGVVGCFFFTH